MFQTIFIHQLGEHSRCYSFSIHEQPHGIYVYIPGHGGGPDGPTIPDFPEQEKWMREHSGLKEVWYLSWVCKDKQELEDFIQKLDKSKTT